MKPVRAVVAAALACLVGGLVVPSSADAARDGVVQVALPGQQFTSAPAGPLLEVDSLVPGETTSEVLGVRNTEAGADELGLRFVVVHDSELGAALRFAVAVADAPSGPFTETWTGTAGQLSSGIDAGATVRSGADRWVRISAALPGTTGNAVEADTFDFRLRVELVTRSEIKGITIGPPGAAGAGGGGGRLAVTGFPQALLLAGGALLVVAGALLLRSAAVTRRSGRSPPKR